MDWKELFREGELLVRERKVGEAIEHYQGMMEKAQEEPKVYFWSLKYLGDVVGYLGLKDYLQAIDIYQKIINEYEDEEDSLYNWCQLDISRAYLEMGLEMLQNFDSMREMLEPVDEEMEKYYTKILEKRNDYIEREAEILYKERM